MIYSDLWSEIYLIYATVDLCVDLFLSLDLWLCDFDGLKYKGLELNDEHLSDDSFFDLQMSWKSISAIDIFNLEFIFYTILTSYWSYRKGLSFVTVKNKNTYQILVNKLFTIEKFPDMSKLNNRYIIKTCWNHQYKTTKNMLEVIKSEMIILSITNEHVKWGCQ